MEEFRVIIAGTRNFSNYELLKEKCDNILSSKRQDSNIVILSGTAKGADRLGERYARERGFLLRRFPADWDKDGNKAGLIRNAKMADNADALIAFWDGTSRGTAHMIMTAKEKGLATRVINYKIAVKMNENQKIEKLRQKTADNAIEYIKTGTGIDCLRDSFNELCKEMGIPTPQAPDNYEREDIINALKEEPWVKDIAAKPADQRTAEEIDRIVNDFYCEHWLMKPEEVTSKDVAQLMNFADPNSHRHIVAQRVAIDCIHALNHEQLQQLDKALDAIAANKTVHEIADRNEHLDDSKHQEVQPSRENMLRLVYELADGRPDQVSIRPASFTDEYGRNFKIDKVQYIITNDSDFYSMMCAGPKDSFNKDGKYGYGIGYGNNGKGEELAIDLNMSINEKSDYKDLYQSISETLNENKKIAAQQAIVDRVMDYGARCFSSEQIDTLERVVADCENETQREHTYERLWTETEPRLTDAMKEWKDDAHEELRDLAHGIARSEEQGLKR